MTVLMIATITGDPDDLAQRYERQQSLFQQEFGGPPPGFLFHACARTDDGLVVTNLVESEETVWTLRLRFEKTADAVGLPPPNIDVHPVVNAIAREVAPSIA